MRAGAQRARPASARRILYPQQAKTYPQGPAEPRCSAGAGVRSSHQLGRAGCRHTRGGMGQGPACAFKQGWVRSTKGRAHEAKTDTQNGSATSMRQSRECIRSCPCNPCGVPLPLQVHQYRGQKAPPRPVEPPRKPVKPPPQRVRPGACRQALAAPTNAHCCTVLDRRV